MNAMAENPAPIQPTAISPVLSDGVSATAASRTLFKRLLRPVLGAVVVIGLFVTGAWWFTEGRYIETTDNAYLRGDIAVLGPRIEGDVSAIPVVDNQRVKAGDPLIVLDDRDWKAKLAQAVAATREAQAAVRTAQSQVVQQSTMIASADAAIAQAQAELTRASSDAVRTEALVKGGWASRQADELAVAQATKARGALAAAQSQKATTEQALIVSQAQVEQATARAEMVTAAQTLAQNNLDYTIIRAPFDGVIGNRAAQLGQHVATGAQLIAVAPPAAQLYVIANFKETQLAHLRPGMKVRLTPDIDSSKVVDGRIDSLAPATGALFSLLPPENATGNFTKVVQRVPVKIVIDPAEAARADWLRAGLSITAEADTRGPDAERLGLFGAAAATLSSTLGRITQ